MLQNRRLNQHLLYTIVDEVRRRRFSRVAWNLAKVVCVAPTGLRSSLLRYELMIYESVALWTTYQIPGKTVRFYLYPCLIYLTFTLQTRVVCGNANRDVSSGEDR